MKFLRSKYLLWVCSLLLVFPLFGFAPLSTEQYLKQSYKNSNGTWNSYPTTSTYGKEVLSESISLYMQYLVLKGDKEAFKEQVSILKSLLLQPNSFIYWRYFEDGTPSGTANALIDDLRVIQSLRDASTKFNEPSYSELAQQIQNFIVRYQFKKGTLVDFTNPQGLYPSSFLTTSYPDPITIVNFPEPLRTNTLNAIRNIPNRTFYPLTFNVVKKTYKMQTTVNMIDQALIALNRQRVNVDITPFLTFVKSEMNRTNKIMGRYTVSTSKPDVAYESTSVYAILLILAVEREDFVFAQQLYNRMNDFRDASGSFAVGYEGHFFDQVYPLVAEQTFMNALNQ